MLEYEQDKDGNLLGVVDYWIVNKSGTIDDDGNFCWINEFYISPKYRNNGLLGKFVIKITEKHPQLKWGYYIRRKYNNRMKMFSKRQWLKIANRSNKEE